MSGVRTLIVGRPRRLPSDRRAAAHCTLLCEEPVMAYELVAGSFECRHLAERLRRLEELLAVSLG